MKKLLLIAMLFLSAKNYGQSKTLPIDSETHKITYAGVVKADGATKQQLYLRAREWFARTFVSSKEVIQMDDKEAGKIIGKGSAQGTNTWMGGRIPFYLEYTVSVTVKDNKYKYEISDFFCKSSSADFDISEAYTNKNYRRPDGSIRERYKDYFVRVYELGVDLPNSIKTALSKPPTSKDDF